jgi:alanine-alpha-ketoisovalerate/valine-pyruvate aminotransferase
MVNVMLYQAVQHKAVIIIPGMHFFLFSSIFSNFSEFAYNSLIIKVCIFYLGDPANFGGYVCS